MAARPDSLQILMVEDVTRYHPIYEAAIHEALGSADVSFASDGKQALELIAQMDNIDIIVLDLNIPHVSGEEVLKKIRSQSRYNDVPVIVLTGNADQDTQSRLLEQGADDFIEKGSPPQVFGARLRAQARHRMALDRMTRMALDMDLFVAGVLHDIRNIETSMVALCDLVKLQVQTDPLKNQQSILDDVGSLREQANRISTYASAVIAKLKEQRHDPKMQAIIISDILSWVRRSLTTEGHEDRGFEWEQAGDLEPVLGDEHFLRVALFNICQNAIKYRRSEEPCKLMISQRPGPNETVITCLRDHGQGIPGQELKRVFQPFIRGQKPHNTEGFGLGLAMVHRAISLMHGQVWAEPPEDGGHGVVICIALGKTSANMPDLA